jgi:putative oxidoreductase
VNALQNAMALLGRILLALVFVPASFNKISGFSDTVGYSAAVGLPFPEAGVTAAILIELLGGIALLIGFQSRFAAFSLAVFTLVASFFFHAYWTVPAEQQMIQQLMFFKNIAIVGGLLAFTAFGTGAISVDARRSGS